MDSLVQQIKDFFFSLLRFILGRSDSNVQDLGATTDAAEKSRLNKTVRERGFTEVRSRGATLVGERSPPPPQTN